MPLTTPTVHLNGTGFLNLWTEYENVAKAHRELERAFDRVEFNARDYYVQGPDAWTKARDERFAIQQKMRDIKDYLDEIRLALDDQRPKERA